MVVPVRVEDEGFRVIGLGLALVEECCSKRMMKMTRASWSVGSALCATALVASMMGGVGCVDTSEDYVYLHIIHGYPGADEITVYGPEGTLVSGLKFGTATDKAIRLNRQNFDGTINVAISGVPGLVIANADVFDLYPQETATLFVGRRDSLESAQVNLIRHLIFSNAENSALRQCVLQPHNYLSTTNNSLLNNTYSFMLQKRSSAEEILLSYNPALESQIQTECGPIPLNQLGATGMRILNKRRELINQINESGWLYLVLDPENEEAQVLIPVFGVWSSGEDVLAVPTSFAFVQCISGAITLQQEEPDMMMMNPNAPPVQEEPTCKLDLQGNPIIPRDMNGNPLVKINNVALEDCLNLQEPYAGIVFEPGSDDVEKLLVYSMVPSAGQCSSQWRVRSPLPGPTIFDQGPTGRSGDTLVTFSVEHPSFTTQSVILYGRPLDPLIMQFNHHERSVPTKAYPANKPFDPDVAPGRTTPDTELPGENELFD
jgi:hypothetical protein